MKVLLAHLGEKLAGVRKREGDSRVASEGNWDGKRNIEAILERRPVELGDG